MRRACLRVTKQFPNDRQPKAATRAEARVGVAEIVEANAVQAGALAPAIVTVWWRWRQYTFSTCRKR